MGEGVREGLEEEEESRGHTPHPWVQGAEWRQPPLERPAGNQWLAPGRAHVATVWFPGQSSVVRHPEAALVSEGGAGARERGLLHPPGRAAVLPINTQSNHMRFFLS